MRPLRKQRIASFLRAEIARVLLHEIRDPRIGFVTVLAVEPTEDLKEAKVSVSVLGTEAEQRTALRGLHAARGFIQSHLARVCQFRETPLLRFVLDDSIRRTMELEEKIRQVREEDEAARETRAGGAAGATEATGPELFAAGSDDSDE